ncbi:hypothetical protein LINPERPRIM_LOCUS5592 [Linum perenne]
MGRSDVTFISVFSRAKDRKSTTNSFLQIKRPPLSFLQEELRFSIRLQGFFNPSTRVGQWAKLNYHVSGFRSLFTYLVYALDLSQRLFSSTQTKGLRAKLNSTEILTECRDERPGGGTGVLEEDCRHDSATEDLPDEDRIPIGGRYATVSTGSEVSASLTLSFFPSDERPPPTPHPQVRHHFLPKTPPIPFRFRYRSLPYFAPY